MSEKKVKDMKKIGELVNNTRKRKKVERNMTGREENSLVGPKTIHRRKIIDTSKRMRDRRKQEGQIAMAKILNRNTSSNNRGKIRDLNHR